MRLRFICEFEGDVVRRMEPLGREIAKRVSRAMYNRNSYDPGMEDDLYQTGMAELLQFLKKPGAQQYVGNDQYLATVIRRGMTRGGKRSDGTKIGPVDQVGPTHKGHYDLRNTLSDRGDMKNWTKGLNPNAIPDTRGRSEETRAVQEIVSRWPEREQFLMGLILAGRFGREIAELEAQKYGRAKPVSVVSASKWAVALKDKLKKELEAYGITESALVGPIV